MGDLHIINNCERSVSTNGGCIQPVGIGYDTLPCAVWNGNAMAKGRQIGRPQVRKEDIHVVFLRHYPAHKNGQLNISELARVYHISRTTVYKYKALLEA